MKFKFKYKKKEIKLDIKVCKTILSKTSGLMFRRKSKSLLFVFKKPVRISIHSFFCKPFVVIWFLNNKIIDIKVIKKWKVSIKPKQKFDRLLEIPSSIKEFKLFTDENLL